MTAAAAALASITAAIDALTQRIDNTPHTCGCFVHGDKLRPGASWEHCHTTGTADHAGDLRVRLVQERHALCLKRTAGKRFGFWTVGWS